jgi:hypothetical protein
VIRRILVEPLIVAICTGVIAFSLLYVLFASGWDGVISDQKVLVAATALLAIACILGGIIIRRQ